MSEKEISLEYNGYNITLKIKNNYKEAKEAIKTKLYLKDRDIEKYGIYYYDEENDINDITNEDDFSEGFNKSQKWGVSQNEEEEEKNPDENLNNIKEKIQEVKTEIKNQSKKFQGNIMKTINEISNKKISEIIKRYEIRISKLEDIINSLKIKNRDLIQIIEKMKKDQDNMIQKISNYAEKKIEEKFEEYNSEFENYFNSKISENKEGCESKKQDIKNTFDGLYQNQEQIKKAIEDSKLHFSAIFTSTKGLVVKK